MQVSKKFLKLGTGPGELNASDLPSNFGSPTNYTPDSSDVKGHLSGIDTKLGAIGGPPGDIGHTSFSIANNQASPVNVTGLAFANGSTRAAQVFYSIIIDATADLFESGELTVIQKGASWDLARQAIGDDSLIDFTINSSGQVLYTSSNYTGFVAATMKFRAITTNV